MWTAQNRRRYDRSQLRYPSDLTDDEWAHIAPLIPPAKSGGNKRSVDVREVMNAIMYILSTGCQWRAIPKDLPPRSTVHNYFIWWQCDGVLDRIHDALATARSGIASGVRRRRSTYSPRNPGSRFPLGAARAPRIRLRSIRCTDIQGPAGNHANGPAQRPIGFG